MIKNILAHFLKRREPQIEQWLPTPPGENEIVWIQDLSKYKFVRTRIFFSSRRNTPPGDVTAGLVVGFSVLGQDQKRDLFGFFERRYFYLQPLDLQADCIYLKKHGMPAEGVNPKTVKPGVWGLHVQPGDWQLLNIKGGK